MRAHGADDLRTDARRPSSPRSGAGVDGRFADKTMSAGVTIRGDDGRDSSPIRLRTWRSLMTVIDWLLDADPAIRWQVMRDLTHEPDVLVAAERARIATEGWGARLLALQAPDGRGEIGRGRRTGRTRSTSWSSFAGSGSTRRASRHATRSLSSRSTSSGAIRRSRLRGPTTGSSRARSSRASTATSSRPAPTSGST